MPLAWLWSIMPDPIDSRIQHDVSQAWGLPAVRSAWFTACQPHFTSRGSKVPTDSFALSHAGPQLGQRGQDSDLLTTKWMPAFADECLGNESAASFLAQWFKSVRVQPQTSIQPTKEYLSDGRSSNSASGPQARVAKPAEHRRKRGRPRKQNLPASLNTTSLSSLFEPRSRKLGSEGEAAPIPASSASVAQNLAPAPDPSVSLFPAPSTITSAPSTEISRDASVSAANSPVLPPAQLPSTKLSPVKHPTSTEEPINPAHSQLPPPLTTSVSYSVPVETTKQIRKIDDGDEADQANGNVLSCQLECAHTPMESTSRTGRPNRRARAQAAERQSKLARLDAEAEEERLASRKRRKGGASNRSTKTHALNATLPASQKGEATQVPDPVPPSPPGPGIHSDSEPEIVLTAGNSQIPRTKKRRAGTNPSPDPNHCRSLASPAQPCAPEGIVELDPSLTVRDPVNEVKAEPYSHLESQPAASELDPEPASDLATSPLIQASRPLRGFRLLSSSAEPSSGPNDSDADNLAPQIIDRPKEEKGVPPLEAGKSPSASSSLSPWPYHQPRPGVVILYGVNGAGKSAMVYASAAQEDFDVLEIWPGMGRRTGISLDAALGEATRNHVIAPSAKLGFPNAAPRAVASKGVPKPSHPEVAGRQGPMLPAFPRSQKKHRHFSTSTPESAPESNQDLTRTKPKSAQSKNLMSWFGKNNAPSAPSPTPTTASVLAPPAPAPVPTFALAPSSSHSPSPPTSAPVAGPIPHPVALDADDDQSPGHSGSVPQDNAPSLAAEDPGHANSPINVESQEEAGSNSDASEVKEADSTAHSVCNIPDSPHNLTPMPVYDLSVAHTRIHTRPPVRIRQKANQVVFLLEEADLLFDDDRGFWPAVADLTFKSQRPVVITCSSLDQIPLDILNRPHVIRLDPPSEAVSRAYLAAVAISEKKGLQNVTAALHAGIRSNPPPRGMNDLGSLPSDGPLSSATLLHTDPPGGVDLRKALMDIQSRTSSHPYTTALPTPVPPQVQEDLASISRKLDEASLVDANLNLPADVQVEVRSLSPLYS